MKQTIDFLIELIKYRRIILITLILSTIISVVTVFLIPIVYTASIAIVPPQDSKQSLLGSLTSISKLSSDLNISGFGAMTVDIYSDMLRSDLVTDGIINKYHLQDKWGTKSMIHTRRKLKEKTKINITTSEMLALSVSDNDPEFAAQLCDDFIYYLDKAMRYLDKTKLTDQLTTMNNLLDVQETVLNDKNAQLITWQIRNGTELLENSSMQKNPAITMLYSKLAEEQLDYYLFKQDHPNDSKTLDNQREIIKSIEKSIDSTLFIVRKAPKEVVEYLTLRAEIESAIIMKQEILSRINYVKSQINSNQKIVYTLGDANVPDLKSFPPRKVIVIIVFILVLMIDVLIIGIKYYFKNNLSESENNILISNLKKVINDPFQIRKN